VNGQDYPNGLGEESLHRGSGRNRYVLDLSTSTIGNPMASTKLSSTVSKR